MTDWNLGLTDYMKDITTLIHCFMVIGFTEKDIQDHYEFGEKLEPKILSQFPPAESCQIKVPEMLSTVTII